MPRQPWAKRRFSGIKRSCHASQLLVITADGSSIAATEHGRQTRERIVRATAGLIADDGPAGTSLDDVRAATGTSKSQLYHYFGDKHGLVEAVVDHQCTTVLGLQAQALASVNDWDGVERWAEAMVSIVDQQGARGAVQSGHWPQPSPTPTSDCGGT